MFRQTIGDDGDANGVAWTIKKLLGLRKQFCIAGDEVTGLHVAQFRIQFRDGHRRDLVGSTREPTILKRVSRICGSVIISHVRLLAIGIDGDRQSFETVVNSKGFCRDRVQRTNTDQRNLPRVGERFAGRDADSQTGERAGADRDGNKFQIGRPRLSAVEQVFDLRCQRLSRAGLGCAGLGGQNRVIDDVWEILIHGVDQSN